MRGLIPPALLAVIALAGCGGGTSAQAQVHSCWVQKLAAYDKQYSANLSAPLKPKRTLIEVNGKALAYSASMYEIRKQLPSRYTTSAWNAEFKKIETDCGRLNN